ncbi:hypothetical protein ABH906_003976 [Pseudomonas frederiksbergensis]
MAGSVSWNIDLGKVLDRVLNFIFGTVSSRLMLVGIGLMSYNLKDVLVYAIQTVILKKNDAQPPGNSIGWMEGLGLLVFAIGLLIPLYHWLISSRKNLQADRLIFKQTYLQMSVPQLQDECERLYGIKNADTQAIRTVLGHPTNVNGAIALFQFGYMNVIYHAPWFRLRDKWFKFRYNVGFLIWILFPVHIALCLLLGALELYNPGLLNSGPYAGQTFIALAILESIGAYLIFGDLKRMGRAITLVEFNR